MSVLPLRSIIKPGFIACLLGIAITLLLKSQELQRHDLQDFNDHDCRTPSYNVRLLSYDPLIMHIENFITPHERQYLQKVSKPIPIRPRAGKPLRAGHAEFPRNDRVVSCIAQRAGTFQGYVPSTKIDLQVTSYKEGQEYKPHFDWIGNNKSSTERVTTFFGVLDAKCENCGTQFPHLAVDWTSESEEWCNIVDCKNRDALTIKPVPGSVLFWRNLHENGTGDTRTLHAGLPVEEGFKIGLNIWTHGG